jgi:hypothetical protein
MAGPSDAPNYYATVNLSATGQRLKKQLKKLIQSHKVLRYHEVWEALEAIELDQVSTTRREREREREGGREGERERGRERERANQQPCNGFANAIPKAVRTKVCKQKDASCSTCRAQTPYGFMSSFFSCRMSGRLQGQNGSRRVFRKVLATQEQQMQLRRN